MTAPELYPLSEFTPEEAAKLAEFDAAPTPPEVLREQVARELWAADAEVDVDQLSGETPQRFYRLADAALAVFRDQQDPAVQRTIRPLDEARSRLYAWLGDCTSQSDGDEWTHDRLRPAVDQLLARVREVQP